MVRKSTAVHKNNEYKIFKPNSLFCNNKNIRNACPKLPALTVCSFQVYIDTSNFNSLHTVLFGNLILYTALKNPKMGFSPNILKPGNWELFEIFFASIQYTSDID